MLLEVCSLILIVYIQRNNIFLFAFTVHNITVSVPLNTGLVGGITKREQFEVSTDISFEDMFERLCAKMNLNPCNASLGYKFNKDLRRTKYNELTNEDQLRTALARGVELIERARTRPVVLEIQNLV